MEIINALLFIWVFLVLVQGQTYRARVLDYTPILETNAKLTVKSNLELIEKYVNGSADIFVFPEYSLTPSHPKTLTDLLELEDYAVEVPEIGKTDYCGKAELAHEVIIKLSCIAKIKSKYIVVNIIETVKKEGLLYNTNIVFDRSGFLIAKYRKINLFANENFLFTPGTKLVTFKTDFNVHFGLFTCFDILFKKPALDILNEGVTDIIYPTRWYSTTPFLTPLQTQDGYAKKTGVNLLAAGYNDPIIGNGGSGIYLANGEIYTFINTVPGITLIEHDIPIIFKRNKNYTCNNKARLSPQTRAIGTTSDVNFYLENNRVQTEYFSFNFEELSRSKLERSSELCSPDKKICCNFYAKQQDLLEGKKFTYMFTAYSSSSIGKGCALLSCNSTDSRTCGNRLRTDEFIFDEVNISSSNTDIYVMPSTLGYNIHPLDSNSYTFCSSGSNNEIKGKALRSITTFGIYSSLIVKAVEVVESGASTLRNCASTLFSILLYCIFK